MSYISTQSPRLKGFFVLASFNNLIKIAALYDKEIHVYWKFIYLEKERAFFATRKYREITS